MGRYLALKIIVISFFILFLAILQVSNVNADGVNKLGKSKSSKILDYGVRGHVFPIIEESLLEIIMAKLKIAKQNGNLGKMQKDLKISKTENL